MSGEGERLRHQEAWELIPWYVNGTLVEGEAAQVEEHLERCPLCRREVAANRTLAAALAEVDVPPRRPPIRASSACWPASASRWTTAATSGGSPLAPTPMPPRRAGRAGWLASTPRPARRVLAAQLAAVLLLAVALGWSLFAPAGCLDDGAVAGLAGRPELRPAFRTLSQPSSDLPPAAGGGEEGTTVRLLFAAGTTEAEMRRLLLGEGGRLVAGPSPTGVYTAAFAAPDGGGGALVERLRGMPMVELVEAVRPRSGGE